MTTEVSPGEIKRTWGSLVEAAAEFAKLKTREKELAAEATIIKDKLDTLSPELVSFMEEGGVGNIKVGGFTIYLHSQMWGGVVEGADKADLVRQMKEYGETEFLINEGYNAQQLASWVRELPRETDGDRMGEAIIPVELRGLLQSNTITKPRARKA